MKRIEKCEPFGGLGGEARPDADFFRCAHQISDRRHLHFFHHPAAMDFNGLLTGAQDSGDLLVQHPTDNQCHHCIKVLKTGGGDEAADKNSRAIVIIIGALNDLAVYRYADLVRKGYFRCRKK